MTRRRWILDLGGTTVLAGFSGLDLEASDAAPLPPGLYGPSLDHLAHALRAESVVEEFATPRFFDSGAMDVLRQTIAAMLDWDAGKSPVPTIAAWIDLVLSESAGTRRAAKSLSAAHRALAVAFYGSAAVKGLETANADETFRIERFQEQAFLRASRPEQIAKLSDWEAERDSSVLWLKRRVIEGFYTSLEGLQELDYKGNAFYPESPGCGHAEASR